MKKRGYISKWIISVAITFFSLSIVIGAFVYFQYMQNNMDFSAAILAEAAYPKTIEKPVYDNYEENEAQKYLSAQESWLQEKQERLALVSDYPDDIDVFFSKIMKSFSGDTTSQNNIVYSPLNVYAILAVAAEMADGNSQTQILNVLGAEDMDELRNGLNTVLNSNYVDDGNITSIFANSVWLRNNIKYKKETIDNLSQNYLASAYFGKMGSREYDALLHGWLMKQTNGFVGDMMDDMTFDPETALALLSTSHYQANWRYVFADTVKGGFYSGVDKSVCNYMRRDMESVAFRWDDTYSAVALELRDSGKMWIILPEENVTPEEVLQNTDVIDMILGIIPWKNRSTSNIRITIPVFDVNCRLNIQEYLEQLGITDIFVADTADFSNILSGRRDSDTYVSDIEQITRFAIDGEGCMADAIPNSVIDSIKINIDLEFTVNRPFIVVVTGDTGVPLYMGIIQQI